MAKRTKSYKTYSLGLLLAWGLALFLVWLIKGDQGFDSAAKVFLGFFLGWISTTIARNLYPKQPGLLG